MTNGTEGKGRLAIGVAVAVVAVIAIVFVVVRPWGGGDEGSAEREGSTEGGSSPPRGRPEVEPTRPLRTGEGKAPSAPVQGSKAFAGRPTRLASGPLRFVARYGEGRPRRPGAEPRTREEARELVESIRARVIRGEDPFQLIRELSDPPVGIPAEVVGRHENLEPGQASAIETIDEGFAIFFGNPGHLPAGDGGSE